MKITEDLPLSTIAADLPASRGLFESLGIDYSTSGPRSVGDAARAEGLDAEIVLAGLRRITSGKTESWDERPLGELIRHLIEQHHHFVRDELMSLTLWLSDLCAPWIRPAAELQSLRAAFTRLADTIFPHLHDEEIAFARIEALENARQSSETRPVNGELRARIHRLVEEHGTIAAQLRTIRELRMRLMTSNDVVPRLRRALEAIGDLEAHLHEYMFLENCILFPRAIALEEQIAAA